MASDATRTLAAPFVIHVREMEQYPDAVYIGRASPRLKLKKSIWHNPYKIGATHLYNPKGDTEYAPLSLMDVIERYRSRIWKSPDLLHQLPDLAGKPLACWCRWSDEPRTPKNLCHGDVLVQIVSQSNDVALAYRVAQDITQHATWVAEHKRLNTIQRLVKQYDHLLNTSEGLDPDPITLVEMFLSVMHTANQSGIRMDHALVHYLKRALAVEYGDPETLLRQFYEEQQNDGVSREDSWWRGPGALGPDSH